ncbi:MAG: outer membrane beta-barrel protein [Proteobacteria bacterium]|nr:outer membrane beta-barrel protein [Pseudomonadota bacterium]
MKFSTAFLSTGLAFAVSQLGEATPLSLQAQIIGAHGRLDPSKTEYRGSTEGLTQTGAGTINESVTAPGVGASFTVKMTEAARLAGTYTWINFDEGNTKPQYSDSAVGLNASYDVYKFDEFAVYGLGGFSYHWLKIEDRKLAGETLKLNDASLVNYDLGLGTRIQLATNMRFDVAYRYSDSLQKDDVDTETVARGLITKGKFTDLALQTNELVASVGYQF